MLYPLSRTSSLEARAETEVLISPIQALIVTIQVRSHSGHCLHLLLVGAYSAKTTTRTTKMAKTGMKMNGKKWKRTTMKR